MGLLSGKVLVSQVGCRNIKRAHGSSRGTQEWRLHQDTHNTIITLLYALSIYVYSHRHNHRQVTFENGDILVSSYCNVLYNKH